MKRLIFTVTNDLNYDQRMQRICSSLQKNGYDVLLIGRKTRRSNALVRQIFKQKRINCIFDKGLLFYSEYNLRLFFYLLFLKADTLCAIDLDTILPIYFVSILRRTKRIYDAHEYFTEQKEIITRPFIHKAWLSIERFSIPRFQYGYTVNNSLKDFFSKNYSVNYEVIRNFASIKNRVLAGDYSTDTPYIIYQGAINEGRGFEELIPAMHKISIPLYIYGKGNFEDQAKHLVKKYSLENKVFFKGSLLPDALKIVTSKALFGILLMDSKGKNNYYSLANRFSDYIMAGIPQICMDYPEYAHLNNQLHCADLIPDYTMETLIFHINRLIDDQNLYSELKENTIKAQEHICWENEENKLYTFYSNILSNN